MAIRKGSNISFAYRSANIRDIINGVRPPHILHRHLVKSIIFRLLPVASVEFALFQETVRLALQFAVFCPTAAVPKWSPANSF